MAARLGSTPMAAFQICLQVWMTSSLLADGLAVAGQAILACAFAEKDYKKVTATATRVLQMSIVLGMGLAVFVGLGLYFGSGIFTKDAKVLHIISIGVPVVVAAGSITSIVLLSKSNGFIGIWVALTIYMALRAIAGVWRMGTATGPWRYLTTPSMQMQMQL
ncbi:Multi antimicrobial extrusion protein [Corchorus olitorius]|uniref:Multi antimicrobial extrusion protein n=1 Tax=Corchorus olitorius TaxID=93759 RepID=A0A1R3KSK5_9ROSI|nr:Multi antimicrobial extrusion protein [Corchorus olitorius]